MTHYFTAETFDPRRLTGLKMENKVASDGTQYSSIELQYLYPCDICSEVPPGEVSTCTRCNIPCPVCTPFMDECGSCLSNGSRLPNCPECREIWDNCKRCTEGFLHNNTIGKPMLKLSDLKSDYGLTFSSGPKMFGKMSIGFTIDYNNPDHLSYFGDSNLTDGQPDGVLKKIRMRAIRILRELGGSKYPKYGREPMDENILCTDKSRFAAHIRAPPSEEEIREDKTGNMAKKSKEFSKWIKCKYFQSKSKKDYNSMTLEERKTADIMAKQKQDGLAKGEKPVNVYSFTKFFFATSVDDPENKNNKTIEIRQFPRIQDLSGKCITGHCYIDYSSIYIGTTIALVESLNQFFLTAVEETKSSRFVDNDRLLSNIKMNSAQMSSMLSVGSWLEKKLSEASTVEEEQIQESSDGINFDPNA